MIAVLTVDEVRQAEVAANEAGFTYSMMMENAGRALAERALALVAARPEAKVMVLVGAGNNGGDGLVAARLIQQAREDIQVRAYLLTRRDDDLLRQAQEAGVFIAYSEDDGDKRVARNMAASSDLIIDALFGIGFRPPLKDEALSLVRNVRQAINERANARREGLTLAPALPGQVERPPQQFILAVDCPSGLNADTGDIDKNALHADETVTFIAAKPGLFAFPGAAAVGKLYVAKLDMPEKIAVLEKPQYTVIDNETVRNLLPERAPDSHKGTFGKVMILSGSVDYIGAAALCARSAYRSGAGLVTVGTPIPVVSALAGQILEATWLLLAHDMGVLAASAAPIILDAVKDYDAMLIGPGLGRESTTGELLEALLQPKPKQSKRVIGFGSENPADAENDDSESHLPPLVIDADGLNLLSDIANWWEKLPENTIITPHPGEMGRLANLEIKEVQAQREALAREKAQAWDCIVVLKGAHTLIAAPDGRLTVSPFKEAALATAGTGDVLAGVIAGLVGQGLAPYEAAIAGVYIQGLAGGLAARDVGSLAAVMAEDVMRAIPMALAAIAG